MVMMNMTLTFVIEEKWYALPGHFAACRAFVVRQKSSFKIRDIDVVTE